MHHQSQAKKAASSSTEHPSPSIGYIGLKVIFDVDFISGHDPHHSVSHSHSRSHDRSRDRSADSKLLALFKVDDCLEGTSFAFMDSDCGYQLLDEHQIRSRHGLDEEQPKIIYKHRVTSGRSSEETKAKWLEFHLSDVRVASKSKYIAEKLLSVHGQFANNYNGAVLLPSDSLLTCTFFSVEDRLIDDGETRLLPYAYAYTEFLLREVLSGKEVKRKVMNNKEKEIGEVKIKLNSALKETIVWVDTIKTIPPRETVNVGIMKTIDGPCMKIISEWRRWKDETFTYVGANGMRMLNNIFDRCLDMYYPYHRMILSEKWHSNATFFERLYFYSLQRLVSEHNWAVGAISEMSPNFLAARLLGSELFKKAKPWIIGQMISLSCTALPYAKDIDFSEDGLIEGADTYGSVGLCLSGDCEDCALFCYKLYLTFMQCDMSQIGDGPFADSLRELRAFCEETYVPVTVAGHVSADSASGKERSELARTAHMFSGLVDVQVFKKWIKNAKKKTHQKTEQEDEPWTNLPVVLFEGTGINHGLDSRDGHVMRTYKKKISLFEDSKLSEPMRYMDYHNLENDYDPFYLTIASVSTDYFPDAYTYILSPTQEKAHATNSKPVEKAHATNSKPVYGVDYNVFMRGKGIMATPMPMLKGSHTTPLTPVDYTNHISKRRNDKLNLICNSSLPRGLLATDDGMGWSNGGAVKTVTKRSPFSGEEFTPFDDNMLPRDAKEAVELLPPQFDMLPSNRLTYYNSIVETLHKAKKNLDKLVHERRPSSDDNDINDDEKLSTALVYYCRADIVARDSFVKDFERWLEHKGYWVDYVIQYGLEYVSDVMIVINQSNQSQ